jgi:uncharacterized membrane protein YqjE
MARADFFARFVDAALHMLRLRLELAAVEVELEAAQLSKVLVMSFAALLFLSIAAVFAGLAVVAGFWDTHPIAALCAVTLFFVSISALLAVSVNRTLRNKPRFMSATIGELKADQSRFSTSNE